MKNTILIITIVLFISISANSQVKKSSVTTVSIAKAILRSTASPKGKKLAEIKKSESITVLNIVKKTFIKATYKGKTGFIKTSSIKQNADIKKFLTAKKPTKIKKVKVAKVGKDKKIGTYKGKTVYQGPKGGKYYLTKSKRKTYLKKEQIKQIAK